MTDVRIEAVDTRARGLRPRRAADRASAFDVLRRLGLLLLAAVLAALAYGLYAINGITKVDPGGSALSRQGLYAAVGLVLMAVAIFVEPQVYRRVLRGLFLAALAGVP